MKIITVIIILLLEWISVYAQEKSIYNNDYLSPFITNPACTGAEYYPVVRLSAKKQWLGFSGSPSTYLLAGNFRIGTHDFYNPKGLVNRGPLKIKDRIGLGAAIFQDNNGPLVNNGGILSYAYHLPVNRKSRLAFGMSVILINHSISTSMLEPYTSNDPYLFTENNQGFKINLGTGLYYYNSSYFVGISATKILRDISNVNEEERDVSSYFVMGGYKFNKESNHFSYEPSITLKKISTTNIIIDLHSKLYIRRLNWIALSYSSIQRLNIQFAIKLYRKLYAGYNYGLTLSKIASYNYGIHEISLGINLGLVGIEGIKNSVDKK